MQSIKRVLRKGSIYCATFIFALFKRLPMKKERVILDSWKGDKLRGSLLKIYHTILDECPQIELVIVGEQPGLRQDGSVKVVKSKSISHLYYLATSKYWIVDTLYYEHLKPRKDTLYIMIWHAAGYFKKFGISSVQEEEKLVKVYQKLGSYLTHLVVSSEKVVDLYAKELAVASEKIIPLGLPRTDEMLEDITTIKDRIYQKYHIAPEKKLVLYAPTFRGEGKTPYLNQLDSELFAKELGKTYVLILKLHANHYLDEKKKEGMAKMVVSQVDTIEDLMKASDVMITDYSSSLFEYALLNRPMLFYAYDLESYKHHSRGFYQVYESFVPGPIVYDTNSLVQAIKAYKDEQYSNQRMEIAHQYQRCDGNCTRRFIKYFFRMDQKDEERSSL